MPFDGIVTLAIRRELTEKLINSRVDRIYQPNKDELLIYLRQPGDTYKLLISAHPSYSRVQLTEGDRENPTDAPSFCMLLRKHLRGARLLSISQPDMDRILIFHFETFDEYGNTSTASLISEIMGKHSNIILIDPITSVIIDGIKHVTDEVSRFREILPGRPYVSPPNQNRLDPRSITKDFFINLMLTGEETRSIQKTLISNYIGLSPIICKEIAAQASLSPDTPKGSLNSGNAERLWAAFSEVIERAMVGQTAPVLYKDSSTGRIVDFFAFTLSVFNDCDTERYRSISAAVEEYYSGRDRFERLEQNKGDIRRLLRQNIERCSRKLALQEEARREAENADLLKINADILMANLHLLKKGMASIDLPNYYTEDLRIEKINMDPSLTGLENAQKYYRKYARSKKSIQSVEEQIKRTWDEVAYLEHVEVALENAETVADIQEIKDELVASGYIRRANVKKNKPGAKQGKSQSQGVPAPIKHMSLDGYEIYIGKNNRQNDYLTMKLANSNDIWFHTKDIPGSHVILRTRGDAFESIPESSIIQAATLAAGYSKAKNSSNVPVDYTLRKHVRKPPGSKPGMVIYDSQKTLFVNPVSQNQ